MGLFFLYRIEAIVNFGDHMTLLWGSKVNGKFLNLTFFNSTLVTRQ